MIGRRQRRVCALAYKCQGEAPARQAFSHPYVFNISEVDHSLGHQVSILENCAERGSGHRPHIAGQRW